MELAADGGAASGGVAAGCTDWTRGCSVVLLPHQRAGRVDRGGAPGSHRVGVRLRVCIDAGRAAAGCRISIVELRRRRRLNGLQGS